MGGNASKSPPNGGLRVHRVYPNGPGDVAGIEPFFDYVLDADGYTYTDDSDETLNLFTKYVNDHENQQICLNVYNARKKSIREVFIVPQKWDGIGLLGLTLKFGLFTCLDQGAHVIHIYDKSPAQKAGLMPITDYLLGTNLQLFFDLDCVRIHVANQIDKEVVLIVYNSVTETVRRAVIVPKENWGGKGTLGCDLAKGYIHRIPYVKSLFTYPTIDSYPSFDSNLSKEVVDTIDLSIGNVDNYYNNSSNNTTLRQDLMTSDRTESSFEKDNVTHGQNNYANVSSCNLDGDNKDNKSDSMDSSNKDTSMDHRVDDNNTDNSDYHDHYTHPPTNTNYPYFDENRETQVLEPNLHPTEHFSYETMNLGNNQTNGNYNVSDSSNNKENASNLVYTSENLLLSPSNYETKVELEVGENFNASDYDHNYNYSNNKDNNSSNQNSNSFDTNNDNKDLLNSDYNQLDMNNSYQPPSMLNLDFTNYNPNNTELNTYNDQNSFEGQVNTSNFNNQENIMNPVYNNEKLFSQDTDNV